MLQLATCYNPNDTANISHKLWISRATHTTEWRPQRCVVGLHPSRHSRVALLMLATCGLSARYVMSSLWSVSTLQKSIQKTSPALSRDSLGKLTFCHKKSKSLLDSLRPKGHLMQVDFDGQDSQWWSLLHSTLYIMRHHLRLSYQNFSSPWAEHWNY